MRAESEVEQRSYGEPAGPLCHDGAAMDPLAGVCALLGGARHRQASLWWRS
jgi:hypothetical protein